MASGPAALRGSEQPDFGDIFNPEIYSPGFFRLKTICSKPSRISSAGKGLRSCDIRTPILTDEKVAGDAERRGAALFLSGKSAHPFRDCKMDYSVLRKSGGQISLARTDRALKFSAFSNTMKFFGGPSSLQSSPVPGAIIEHTAASLGAVISPKSGTHADVGRSVGRSVGRGK